MIPLSIPNLSDHEAEMTSAVVKAGWVSSAGPEVARFGERVADYCGSRFGVPVATGTAALHLALQVAGVQAGDWVLMPNLTFVATANAISYLQATPVLVDISPADWQMDLDLLANWLQKNCSVQEEHCVHTATGKRIPVMVAVHILGYIGDMERLVKLLDEWKILLIEDAAEAMGSTRNGKHAGTFGAIGTLSFNGNKIMTSGGGGMLLTRNQPWAEHAKHLSAQARRHPVEYLHDEVGYNYRMTNLSAALGLAQLDRMAEFLERKRQIAEFYQYALGGIQSVGLPPAIQENHQPNHWMYCIQTAEARILEEVLQVQNIDARKLWVPMNRIRMYSGCTYISQNDHSFEVYENSLCLPVSTGITQKELETVALAVAQFFDHPLTF